MRYPAKVTAEKHELALQQASRLFRARGFDGVSVSEVMQAAGMTHGTFYCHFDSKEHLVAEAVAVANADFASRMREKSKGKTDPKRSYLDAYLSREHRASPDTGCPMASLGPEIARNQGARRTTTEQLRKAIETTAANFNWKDESNGRGNTMVMFSAVLGSLMMSRIIDDEDLSDEILQTVREFCRDRL